MLDLLVRDATAGGRSMDDVMRLMLERHGGERGFTGRNVERAVADVCGCSTRPFFDSYVRGAGEIDVNRYLRLIGLRARVTREPVRGADGQPLPDRRLFGWNPPGERALSLLVTDPSSVWGRAGLHTGDRVVAVNGAAVATWAELRGALSGVRVGDTVRVEVSRPTGAWRTDVVMSGYDRSVARIEEIPDAMERQRALRDRWTR